MDGLACCLTHSAVKETSYRHFQDYTHIESNDETHTSNSFLPQNLSLKITALTECNYGGPSCTSTITEISPEIVTIHPRLPTKIETEED